MAMTPKVDEATSAAEERDAAAEVRVVAAEVAKVVEEEETVELEMTVEGVGAIMATARRPTNQSVSPSNLESLSPSSPNLKRKRKWPRLPTSLQLWALIPTRTRCCIMAWKAAYALTHLAAIDDNMYVWNYRNYNPF
jgi:hypothetical protein